MILKNKNMNNNIIMDPSYISMDNKKMKKRKKEVETMLVLNNIQTTFKLFFWLISYLVIALGIFIYVYFNSPLRKVDKEKIVDERPKYTVFNGENDTTDHLKHVFKVLNEIGYERTYKDNWKLMWSHQYPFVTLSQMLQNLQPHQYVNHFPGCGYITNKKHLSTSQSIHLPAAFKIPEDNIKLRQLVALNKNKYWLKKSNNHRGIKIIKGSDIDYHDSESFIQNFIDNPFLIDGYKFDLGVYVAFTSIDPLRVYAYKGDVLLRFCTRTYHPFNISQEDSYIIGDDYRPIWKVPSLSNYYTHLGYSMKDSLDAYMKSIKKNPTEIWIQIEQAIRDIAVMKESLIKTSIQHYGGGRNYFELVRFDFILDDNMRVYMMEANMSPNLSSAHYPPNQLLYEQVLFNLFSLVGINQRIKENSMEKSDETRGQLVHEMEVANKNLAVLPEVCKKCDNCQKIECQLCIPCWTKEIKDILIHSYKEHQNKLDFQRIFPPHKFDFLLMKDYSLQNQLLIKWYESKCAMDYTWCNEYTF